MTSFSLAVLAIWSSLSYLQQVHALSNITFYSDSSCQVVIGEKNGPDDGTCTPFSTEVANFTSFRVTSLDQTCAVTIYGADPPYCSSSELSLAPFSDCMTNITVNQFSVDCQDYSTAISGTPQVFTGESSGSSTSDSSSNNGLSAGAKAGIGIGAAAGGIGLVALIVWLAIRNNRRKKRDMENAILEADSSPAAPPYSELPNDQKKAPVELPPQAMVPVEAPGDNQWPTRELEGDAIQSELDGSGVDGGNRTPGLHVQSEAATTVVGSDGDKTVSDTGLQTPARTTSDVLSPVSPEHTTSSRS